jgi:hypothetical protein
LARIHFQAKYEPTIWKMELDVKKKRPQII